MRPNGEKRRSYRGINPGGLSNAEIEVMRMRARGMKSQQIADARGCSISTIKALLAQAYGQLGWFRDDPIDIEIRLVIFVAKTWPEDIAEWSYELPE